MKIKLQAFNNSVQIKWDNENNMATFNYDEKEYGEKIVNIATLVCSCPECDICECNENFTQIYTTLDKLLNILPKLI
ncbi:MAG: hypothetical protein WDK95_10440 [Syntrophorhabdaceae bacterium]|jgi:hypothetical protein